MNNCCKKWQKKMEAFCPHKKKNHTSLLVGIVCGAAGLIAGMLIPICASVWAMHNENR